MIILLGKDLLHMNGTDIPLFIYSYFILYIFNRSYEI